MMVVTTEAARYARSASASVLPDLIAAHGVAVERAAKFNSQVAEPASAKWRAAILDLHKTQVSTAERLAETNRLWKAARLPAITRIDDGLAIRVGERLAAVAEHPVSNISELNMKIVYLHAQGAWDFPPVADAIAADVRRLAGEVA